MYRHGSRGKGATMITDTAEVTMETFIEDPNLFLGAVVAKPLALTKNGQPFAYVVSADYYEKAKEAVDALHGHRRVLTRSSVNDKDLATIEGFRPSDAEVASGQWRDQ
jgi:PHD/YefM family antitoxin component YafN of YafNO toxin-antitoxin module